MIEAAESLGISPSTIRAQITNGKLRARKIGRDWHITPAEVERYRRDHRGQRKRPGLHSPETVALRYAALKRPEVREKMRAAKLGRRHTPEHIAAVRAALGDPRQYVTNETRRKCRDFQVSVPKPPEQLARLRAVMARPEIREKMREAQKAVVKSPDEIERMRNLGLARRGIPLAPDHRAKIVAAMDRWYVDGRCFHSELEKRAAEWLLPLGYRRFPRYERHAFDFGSPDGRTVIEVNGCYWHDHRAIDAACPIIPRPGRLEIDQRHRAIAYRHNLELIELWECQESDWLNVVSLAA